MHRSIGAFGLAVVVLTGAAAHALPNHDGVELVFGEAARARIDEAFRRYDVDHERHRAERRARFDEQGQILFAREVSGEELPCSRQIFIEAKWLVGYTAWWDQADATLHALERSFEEPDQEFAKHAALSDGLYGVCATETFIRIEDTLETYFVLADQGKQPEVLRRDTARWARSPEALVEFLDAMLVSDVGSTGEDMRSRVGGLVSILAATQRRDHVMELLRTTRRDGPMTPEQQGAVRAALLDYVNAWQDPVTGYWGAWYVGADSGIFKTTDLSITYHIVHALKGRIDHWPQLIRTTLAIRNQAYPFGWLSKGRWNNHNNYDLARLFRYGWPEMTVEQQYEVRQLMQDMVDYAFEKSLNDGYDGFILYPDISSSVGAELYFGVSFLDAAGYFAFAPWTGQLERPAPPVAVCEALIAHAKRLPEDNYVLGAKSKLKRVCTEHLPPGAIASL